MDNSPGMGGSVPHLAYQITHVVSMKHEAFLIASRPELFGGLIPDEVNRRGLAWAGFADIFKSSGALFKPVLPGRLNRPFAYVAYNHLKSAIAPEFSGILRSFAPDIVHINNLNLPNKVFGDVANGKKIPLVVAALMIRRFGGQEIKFAAGAGAVTCISEAVRDCLASLPGIDPAKMHVIESPINASLYQVKRDPKIRAKLGIPESARLVLSLGRMTPWKGHDVLVRAVGRLPEDVWLLQAGGADGDWRHEIDGIIDECGLKGRVVFAGVRSDVPALLAASDLLVHSSKYADPKLGVVEAFGRVVAEGMAAGLPVVATAAGGPVEILRDTGAGQLATPGDDKATADAMAYYLNNPEEAFKAGEKGRAAVRARYNEKTLGDKLMSVYEALLSGGA